MDIVHKRIRSLTDGYYLMYDINKTKPYLKSIYIFEVIGDNFEVIKSVHNRRENTHSRKIGKIVLSTATEQTSILRNELTQNFNAMYSLSDEEYLMIVSEYV